MTDPAPSDNELIAQAEAAAQSLFNAPDETSGVFEPSDRLSAEAAVRRFGFLFAKLPGTAAKAMDNARSSGDLVSSDRLQGLAEIVQNADDVHATEIRVLLKEAELFVSHNGDCVRLPHVLALATPWLTTKASEAATIGRFGIGLTTLRSLSKTLDVHCGPYHVRVGDPFVSSIPPARLPTGFDEMSWTTFRIPLEEWVVSQSDLADWLDSWDEAALLFLRTVSKISLRAPDGNTVSELTISRDDQGELVLDGLSTISAVARECVTAHDGRSWMVYSGEFPTPADVSRARKKSDSTTPVGVALPLYSVEEGKIHAGLPVAPTRMPLFANAQFDVTTSRRDVADNDWNKALLPLVAELWSVAILDSFARDPKSAWQAVPIAEKADASPALPMVRRLEDEVISSARQRVASQLAFGIAVKGNLALTQLAVETSALEAILTPGETARLAGLAATLPAEVRDRGGIWRKVLDDWRRGGVNLPMPVTVEQALVLLKEEMRSPSNVIALSAAALNENLGEQLLKLPCVVANSGRRFIPPPKDSPEAFAEKVSPLALQLGVITPLHSVHFDGPNARMVLAWLKKCGAVVDSADSLEIVKRLAAAGQSNGRTARPLSDQEVQALRALFERLEPRDRERFGFDVGSAVTLEAYEYELKGRRRRRKVTTAQATDAYLPRAIEREDNGFEVAAHKTPGIVWLSRRYARLLRSSAGRQGIGPQRFLRLLGAERAPRIRRHPELFQRFAYLPPGLRAAIDSGVSARTQVMLDLGATFTLNDHDSPALAAVVEDIARVRLSGQRRNRAAALVATLARAWNRLGESVEVQSAYDYFNWNRRDPIPAYWLWQARDVEWLDDERGTPRRPSELRVRTAGTEAIYGADSPDYLHENLFRPNWQPVLTALGVTGDPSREELVARLISLRDDTQPDEHRTGERKQKVAIAYKALARSLQTPSSRSDLNRARLRQEFSKDDGLILTELGWRKPDNVFGGDPILGKYRAFAPAILGTQPLWVALGLKRPSVRDCVQVIREIARRRLGDPHDDVIVLEALRFLAVEHSSNATAQDRRALRTLPLLTSEGWIRSRPVFATDDQLLSSGLRDRLVMWHPGGELEQFKSLLGPLGVRLIDAAQTEVIGPDCAVEKPELTAFFRTAVQQLRADLARNEPELMDSLTVPWDRLECFSVRVHPSLAVRVLVSNGTTKEVYECSVPMKVHANSNTVFVKNGQVNLVRVDEGGRALATLFKGNARRLAHAWRGACDRAEEGVPATVLELARERAAREQNENELRINERLAAFQKTAARRRSRTRGVQPKSEVRSPSERDVGAKEVRKEKDVPRVLVDPDSLRLCHEHGRVVDQSNSHKKQSPRGRRLAESGRPSARPRNRKAPPSYTNLDREDVGLKLLGMVLGSDREDIIDLRSSRGIGADAMDDLKRYFELKVSAGGEPDTVTLTASEVMRAASDPNFFLVVVSGVEGADARPSVRLILDPLRHLTPGTDEQQITLSGVRASKSLVYDFEPGESDVDSVAETPDPSTK